MTPPSPSMYFDASCGPCKFFAHVTAGLARSDLGVFPLDSPEADRALQALSSEARYSYFHIVEPGKVWTGPNAMQAWVGLLAGARARRVAERAPPVRRLLRGFYGVFWEYRRSHGCAAEGNRRP